MGTIRLSSSHSPIATEAAIGVRLLLFRPAASASLAICSCNPRLSGFAVYGNAFWLSFPPAEAGVPGRSVIQAFAASTPEDFCNYQFNSGPKSVCFLIPCDPASERTLPVSSTC